MIVQVQINITGSNADVWTAITDIQKLAEAIRGIEKIEILENPGNKLEGLKWRETRMYFGKPASVDKWITDAAEMKYYTTKAELDGFTFINTLSLSGTDGNVILTSIHETKPLGLISKIKSIPMLFLKGILRKAILQDLRNFKTAVEAN